MNLSDYQNYAKNDLILDETQLDTESLKTPQLHSKYLNFLMDEKLRLTKLQHEYKVIRRKKWLYYTGKMSQEELEEEDWEPFELTILKTDLDKFLDSDEDLQLIDIRMKYKETIVDYLNEIIKVINNRQWNIRSAIDWLKFTNGQ
tara:strand:+ start:578 stop:1012 length:435 start_codon:yes stop_codon:yes gene_type:complete